MASSRVQTSLSSNETYVGDLQLLSDYAIHQTGSSTSPNTQELSLSWQDIEGAIDLSTEPHPRVQGVKNPSWWMVDWRRVPEYVPVNYVLDREARPTGSDGVEKFFITMTLGGCGLLAVGFESGFLWILLKDE